MYFIHSLKNSNMGRKTNNFIASVKAKITSTLAQVFPTWAIKKMCVKSNPNAKNWVVLDADRAMYIINRLRLSDVEIRERVWSPPVRLELLSMLDSKGRRALASTVCTAEELNVVLEKAGCVEFKLQAIKAYTPSAKKMRELLASAPMDLLRKIACEAPTAFNTVTPKEVLGIGPKQLCNVAKDFRWDLALELAGSDPKWTVKFMELIKEIPPQRLTEMDIAYFKDMYRMATEAKVSLVGLLAYMYVFFKEEYILYVNSYKDYPSFGEEFKEMFPQFVKHLKDGAGHYKSLDMLGTHVNVNFMQKDDAYAWLGIGRELLAKDEVVYGTLLDNIKAIYEANPTVGKELAKRMLQNGRKLDYQIKLKEEVPTAIDDNLLYNRAFELIKYNSRHPYYADAPDYLKFFPFTEWKEDNAKYALRRIVLCGKLPLERLDELSDELKDFVMKTMEAQSQLNALSFQGKVAELVELQLYPEVEIALLSKPAFWEVHILKYIEKYGLSQEAYEYLLKGAYEWDAEFRKFITVYAQKKGLTQKQYMQLMQSVRCSEAPMLRQYVK